MIITLAFTQNLTYAYDLAGGISAGAVTSFQIEVATCSTLNPESAKPFQAVLLDGEGWELPVDTIQSQIVETLPNLLLAGNLAGGVITPFKTLLTSWFFAGARWVATDEMLDTTQPKGLVKVIRSAEKIEFEKVNNVTWAQRCTLAFRTAGVYAS